MHLKKIIAIIVVLGLTGCGEKGKAVSQTQFGDEWPLILTEGRVSCVWFPGRRKIVTFIAPDGKEYSLNGQASSSGYFLPIDSIHKPDPTNPPAKKSIVVLISEGLKLCPDP